MVSNIRLAGGFAVSAALTLFVRCGHCKNLAPQYLDKNIKLAKVDCVDQADLCQEQEVKGYP